MTTINPYLTFNGTCEEAFEFYKSVFGGEFQYIGRFSEMPSNPEVPPMSKEDANKIMHVSLPISKETTLMGSDYLEGFGPQLVVGNNFSISISCITPEEVDRLFEALSKGGQVKMPLNKTFWGSYFGMFVDRFGIHWMVSCETGEKLKEV